MINCKCLVKVFLIFNAAILINTRLKPRIPQIQHLVLDIAFAKGCMGLSVITRFTISVSVSTRILNSPKTFSRVATLYKHLFSHANYGWKTVTQTLAIPESFYNAVKSGILNILFNPIQKCNPHKNVSLTKRFSSNG